MLCISLKPSAYLAGVLVGVHIAAAVILLPLDIPHLAKLGLAILVAASLVHSLGRHALLRGRMALIGLELRRKGAPASVQTRDGAWHEAWVLDTTYVSPLLTVLNLRLHGHKYARHILIAPDSTGHDDFRRLRVCLRWGYRNDG